MLNGGKCVRCARKADVVRLFDGVYINEVVKICEKCALISGVPIIKRPSADQLKNSEKPYDVHSRLMRMAGYSPEARKERSATEELKELEIKPELEKPEDLRLKIVDNFNWLIQTQRRRKCLSVAQLAEKISESEAAIRMLESKSVPRNSWQLLEKLEQFFNIKLIKKDKFEKILETNQIVPRSKEFPGPSLEKLEPFKPTPIEPLKKEEEIEVITTESEALKQAAEQKPKLIPPSTFRREIIDKFKMRDLQRANARIDRDMEFPSKSREQVGNEQTDGFGKENTEKISQKIYQNYKEKETSTKPKVPTIYDLMRKKEERERTSITGKDIQVSDEDLE